MTRHRHLSLDAAEPCECGADSAGVTNCGDPICDWCAEELGLCDQDWERWHDDPDDCLECGVCDGCAERMIAYYEEGGGRVNIDYKRPLGIGRLTLWRTSSVDYCFGERRDLLHVMGVSGQCCGYARPAGSDEPWRPQTPWYAGDWPELHAAVARVTGEPVEAEGRYWEPGGAPDARGQYALPLESP